jgi:hypothetical protein
MAGTSARPGKGSRPQGVDRRFAGLPRRGRCALGFSRPSALGQASAGEAVDYPGALEAASSAIARCTEPSPCDEGFPRSVRSCRSACSLQLHATAAAKGALCTCVHRRERGGTICRRPFRAMPSTKVASASPASTSDASCSTRRRSTVHAARDGRAARAPPVVSRLRDEREWLRPVLRTASSSMQRSSPASLRRQSARSSGGDLRF